MDININGASGDQIRLIGEIEKQLLPLSLPEALGILRAVEAVIVGCNIKITPNVDEEEGTDV